MKPRQLHLAFRWALTVAYAAGIFYLSSRRWNGVPSFFLLDKVVHLGLYGGLGYLLYWSLCTSVAARGWRLVLAAIVATVLYGISDEFHQMFVPGRSAELGDVIADGLGGALGATLAMWATARAPRPEREAGEP